MDVLGVIDLPASVILLLACIFLYVYYMSSTHGTFKKLEIPGPKPWPVLGNSIFAFKKGMFNTVVEGYRRFQHMGGMYGVYEGRTPILTVTDLDMLREIMVKQFNHFPNRRKYSTMDQPMIDKIMFNLEDDEWKNHRALLKPTLNPTRLKASYPRVEKLLRSMLDAMENKSKAQGGELDISLLIGCFCMDVIAGIGFDLDCNSIGNPKNDFLVKARNFLDTFGERTFAFALFVPPFVKHILDWLGIMIMPKKEVMFLREFTRRAIDVRRSGVGEKRGKEDFFQFMIDHSVVRDDKKENITAPSTRLLSLEELYGSSLTYFLAGYDTSAKGFFFSMYHLAMHPDCLQKAQEEVDEVLKGEFPNTDNVQNLKYIDMCIKESNRLLPLGPYVERRCSQDTTVLGRRIPAGMNIRVPIAGIHRDPNLYPNPECYNPENFSPEACKDRHPMAFLPFGAGPRACFGQPLAMLLMRVGMAAMIQRFHMKPCGKSEYPVRIIPMSDLVPEHGLWLSLTPRS
ncbi:cytochrome p450 [Plakobranchus ocellatus]|uniref:Cytochrome p450 n=1 Tax=Plakobranchus ocellatus TaxID=259542 RepID=A0AAV4AJ79_9GAST|nr:cytochrome p450 [Plakobranchus ocellatus]